MELTLETKQQLAEIRSKLPEGFVIVTKEQAQTLSSEHATFRNLLNEVVPVLSLLAPGDLQGELNLMELFPKLMPAFNQLKESETLKPLGAEVMAILKKYNQVNDEKGTIQLGTSDGQ